MSKVDFCKKVGISDRYFRYLLNRERDASANIAKKIARALKCETRVFFVGTSKQRKAAWNRAAGGLK